MLQGDDARYAYGMRPHLTKRRGMLVNEIWSLIDFYTNILQGI